MNRNETLTLADSATSALHDAGLDPEQLLVTLDARTAETAAKAGRHVVAISPPSNTYTSHHQVETTWELWLIAGPDPATGWQRLDVLLDALRVPLDLDTARPETFTGVSGVTYPAYVATTAATFHHL